MRAASSRRAQLAALLALLAAAPAAADGDRVAATKLPTCTDGEPFLVYIVDATADDDCDATGGGTTEAPCLCLDGAYVAMLASGGAASDSFKTQNTPSGTDPVADSSTDTLNWTAGAGITLTGDSTTDTITVASTIPSITLDLGDDAGNDSTALAEIATSGDDYGAISEPSADKVLVAFAKIPPYQQYDPDRPPTSCAVCDEWTANTAALTWAWGNQDASTVTVTSDGLLIAGDGTDEMHVYMTDPPAGTSNDLTLTAKVWVQSTGNNNDGCGVSILHGGTLAAPTDLTSAGYFDTTTDAYYFVSDADYNPAAGQTSHGSLVVGLATVTYSPVFLQLRYTDSSRATTAWTSVNDVIYNQIPGTKTLSADPIKIGVFVRDAGSCWIEWFRARTDAWRNQASD